MTRQQAALYIALWAGACLAAAAVYLKQPRAYAISHAAYWRFLLQPWKVVTFAVAATGITVIAPHTGDPTWDYVDALFMSVFAFTTAPWAVGTLYRAAKKAAPARQAFVAICVGLFSASWSYDLYLLLRDGWYPVTWWANLFASSVLYTCGGLFWSLDWRPGKGLTFAFTEQEWPAPSSMATFQRVLWPALLFMVLVSLMILPFLWQGRR